MGCGLGFSACVAWLLHVCVLLRIKIGHRIKCYFMLNFVDDLM